MANNIYGLILLNMGGPGHLEEIEDYLARLFSDPFIIELPFFLKPFQKQFARFLAKKRALKLRPRYQLIGGKSPLDEETKKQAHELTRMLKIPTTYAMRYTSPYIDQAIEMLRGGKVNRLIIIPLYPQYSRVTSKTALLEFEKKNVTKLPYKIILQHFGNQGFIEAHADLLNQTLKKMKTNLKSHILFTAHSIPKKIVKKGDPYVIQVNETARLIYQRLRTDIPFCLAFQSRMGPVKWQGPTLEEALEKICAEKVQQLVIQPLSFVSENLETIYDLDIVFKKRCQDAGIIHYIRVPSLGTQPKYLRGLSELVKHTMNNWGDNDT